MNLDTPSAGAFLLTFVLFFSTAEGAAEHSGELIFEDHFERSESQEIKDEPGNGWTTSSDKTAKGHKQVDLRNGAMYIYTHAEANHATSVRHAFEFTDGSICLRFMLEDEKDSLRINIADMDLKTVWAGHLILVAVSPSGIEINDRKTGDMDLTIRQARRDGNLTSEQKEILKNTKKSFPHELSTGRWHRVCVSINGEELSCSIDGQLVGAFRSPGFAHETKRLLRLLAPRNVYVDDVEIRRVR